MNRLTKRTICGTRILHTLNHVILNPGQKTRSPYLLIGNKPLNVLPNMRIQAGAGENCVSEKCCG